MASTIYRRNASRGRMPDVEHVHYDDTDDTDDDIGVSFFPVHDDDSFMSVRGVSSCSESSDYASKVQKGDTAGFDTQGERTGMLPREILNMNKRSIELYNRALQEGEEKTHSIRLMVVGHYGVGKTTLTKRLFKEKVDIKERKSTNGIDVHVGRCKISLKDGTWFTSPTYAGGNKKNVMQRLAKVMQTTNEKEQIKSATASSVTTTAVETNMKLEKQSKRNEEMAEPPQSGTLEIIRTEDEIMDAQTDTKTEIAASMREHGEIPKVKTGKENKTSLRTNVYTPFQDKHRDVTKGGSNKNIFRRLCNLIPVGKKGNSVASSNVNTSVETIEVKREVPKRWRPFLHRDSIVSITSTIPDTKDLAETGTTSRSVDSLRKSGTNQDTAKAKIEDNVRKDLQEVINEVRHDVFNKDEVLCDLSLWDFAGQNIFYATHQAFLSQRAIYLLVLDISKHIDDTVQDDIWHFDCHGEQECKVAEFIEFWLNSIHEFCSIPGENGPPVILVGTFVDKLEKRSDAERCFFNMQSTLIKKSTNCHLTKRQFDIDNTVDGDENVEELKKHIVEIAAKQSYWGERIPAKWIALEVRLIRLKEEQNMKVLSKEKMKDENRQLPVPIESDEGLELFLKFHHETGTILYFGEDDMKEDILLDPQWLIDAFKSLITAAMFCRKEPEVLKKWLEFDKSAVLTLDLIDLIWTSQEEDKAYMNYKELLLRFMEKLGFMAKPKQRTDEYTKVEDYYFVPCMLKDPPPENVIAWKNSEQIKSTSKLCLTNANEADQRFIPSTAFNKLIAACINQWPLSKQHDKYMIFCGGAIFKLSDNHFLYIFLYEHVIQIWISRLSIEGQNPSVLLSVETAAQVRKILKENVRMQREILPFVKCPKATLYSNEDMVLLDEHGSTGNKEILYDCQKDKHVVSYVDIAKYWVPGYTILKYELASHFDLERRPTEKDFSRIARRIGSEFKQLAFELGLKKPDIDHICIDYHTAADQITVILTEWSKRMHEKATYSELAKALLAVGVDVESVFLGIIG